MAFRGWPNQQRRASGQLMAPKKVLRAAYDRSIHWHPQLLIEFRTLLHCEVYQRPMG